MILVLPQLHIQLKLTINQHRLFAIDRLTTLVPDSEAPGSYTQQPTNGLRISISNTLLKEQGSYNSDINITHVTLMLTAIVPGAAANDRAYFPYYAFANLVNPMGRLELVKEFIILI